MGCFPVDFQEVKRPLKTKSVKRPIKVGKRPINEGKRPIKAGVLVGVSVGCLMGCFRAPPSWRKTAPLKRPIKRSMIIIGRQDTLSKSKLDTELQPIADFLSQTPPSAAKPRTGIFFFESLELGPNPPARTGISGIRPEIGKK